MCGSQMVDCLRRFNRCGLEGGGVRLRVGFKVKSCFIHSAFQIKRKVTKTDGYTSSCKKKCLYFISLCYMGARE